ncbi:hypothetical protein KY285_007929 [Solanum tuberosum]|nr:hypothetical protein KY285_007929 [Solanum tuberosum]
MPTKRVAAKPKLFSKSKPTKGPGSSVRRKERDKVLTREEIIKELKKKRVLNGRVFDPAILTKHVMCNLVDCVALQDWEHLFECVVPYLYELEVREFYYQMVLLEDGGINSTVHGLEMTLSEEILCFILDVPTQGIRSVEGYEPSTDYVLRSSKYENMKCAGVLKKFHKGEHQLYFEFVNKVMLPQTEQCTISSVVDLFFIEQLKSYEAINLPGIILEHMHQIMTIKNGTIKQTFSMATLIECECVEGEVKAKSQVSDLLEKQESLKREMEDFTTILGDKEVEITRLKALLQHAKSQGPCTSTYAKEEIDRLRDKNTQLTVSMPHCLTKSNLLPRRYFRPILM